VAVSPQETLAKGPTCANRSAARARSQVSLLVSTVRAGRSRPRPRRPAHPARPPPPPSGGRWRHVVFREPRPPRMGSRVQGRGRYGSRALGDRRHARRLAQIHSHPTVLNIRTNSCWISRSAISRVSTRRRTAPRTRQGVREEETRAASHFRRPDRLRDQAPRRLGVDAIGPCGFHRPSPPSRWVQYESWSMQDQFSPTFRSSPGELEQCTNLGLSFLPWSPLGGIANVTDFAASRSASIRDSTAGSDLEPTADQFALSSL
jgi:hypothetical protein